MRGAGHYVQPVAERDCEGASPLRSRVVGSGVCAGDGGRTLALGGAVCGHAALRTRRADAREFTRHFADLRPTKSGWVERCPQLLTSRVVCPVLIGRDDQLDALRQVAASVATGSGQMVLVAGEAGIGKSRLVREFAERLGH